MNSKHFYDFPTDSGLKTVNIKDIALMEPVEAGMRVILSVKSGDDRNVSFVARLPWATVSAQIHSMSDEL